MKHLTKPTLCNGWIAANDATNESNLADKIKNSDLVISDLDGTDASPVEQLILETIVEDKYLFDPKTWKWAIESAYVHSTQGVNAEQSLWATFVKQFLKDPNRLDKIKRKYTIQHAKDTFYRGVLDFYKIFNPNALKIYVTRNMPEIAKAYAGAAKFDYYTTEQFNKRESTKQIIERFQDRKKILIKGDSVSEQVIAEYLRELKREGKIEEIVYINIAKSFRRYNPTADANASRNHTAMNEWLSKI